LVEHTFASYTYLRLPAARPARAATPSADAQSVLAYCDSTQRARARSRLIREVTKSVLRIFRRLGTATDRYQRARDVDVFELRRRADDKAVLALASPLRVLCEEELVEVLLRNAVGEGGCRCINARLSAALRVDNLAGRRERVIPSCLPPGRSLATLRWAGNHRAFACRDRASGLREAGGRELLGGQRTGGFSCRTIDLRPVLTAARAPRSTRRESLGVAGVSKRRPAVAVGSSGVANTARGVRALAPCHPCAAMSEHEARRCECRFGSAASGGAMPASAVQK